MENAANTPLVTVDDIVRALEERDELARRLEDLDRKIKGIRDFIGEDRFAAIRPTEDNSGGSEKGPTFRDVMYRALEGAPQGLTYDELRDAVTAAGLGERLQQTPNTFFNTIGRFVARKEAIKVGGVVILPSAYEALSDEEKGEMLGRDQRETTPEAIQATLKEFQAPLTAGDIIDLMETAYPHIKATAIYAALSRLTRDRILKRDEKGRYSLA